MHQTATAEDFDHEPDELPRRPRTRLVTPASVTVLLVLFAACGFIGGVLVQKGQQKTSTVLGASTSARSSTAARGATGSSGAVGGFGGRFGSLLGGAAGSRGTVGSVTNIDGRKLFVTTTAGTTVEVLTTSASKVTKSESVGSNAIHPGDSVVISGITAANGVVTASSVSDTGTGSNTTPFSAGGSSGAASSSGGTSNLFGG